MNGIDNATAADIIRQDKPAKNKTKMPLAATKIEVPKSGSFAISKTGTIINAKVIATLDREGCCKSFLDKTKHTSLAYRVS